MQQSLLRGGENKLNDRDYDASHGQSLYPVRQQVTILRKATIYPSRPSGYVAFIVFQG